MTQLNGREHKINGTLHKLHVSLIYSEFCWLISHFQVIALRQNLLNDPNITMATKTTTMQGQGHTGHMLL